MLVLDSPAQDRWCREGRRENSQELRQRSLEQEILSNTVTVEDDAGRDTSNLLAQMGRPLTAQEVERRLKLCNPNLIFERSVKFPSQSGVYIEKNERTPANTWEKKKIFICGYESGIMPEFSVRHVTRKRVPNPDVVNATGGQSVPREALRWHEIKTFQSETRGWRTLLLRLLHVQLITQWHVGKYFSWVPTKDSKNWQLQTR